MAVDRPGAPPEPRFIFAVCQVGAEKALKDEIGRRLPEFRFAFSRPGYVTFRVPEDLHLADDFSLESVFARTHGISLGKIDQTSDEGRGRAVWRQWESAPFDHLHLWQRDLRAPGDRGFEPGESALVEQAIATLRQCAPADQSPASVRLNEVAKSGELVLDCVLVEPEQWWLGRHRATGPASRWPGGTSKIELPPDAVSRAYRKMVEGLAWSRLPVRAGDAVVEIGSAPGGASQALLDRGLVVTGVDPAEMSPQVLSRRGFTHVRKRAKDMKRREFRAFKWLTADTNTAPNYTLDTVEAIVTHRQVSIRGLLLTLKLIHWEMADQIPAYLRRIRSWGYQDARARQLAFNRQEICVAARRGRL